MKLSFVTIADDDGNEIIAHVDTAVMENPPPNGREDLTYSALLFLSDLMVCRSDPYEDWVGTLFSTDVDDAAQEIINFAICTCGMEEHLVPELRAISEKLLAALAVFYEGEADAPTISVIAFCMLVNPTDKRSVEDRWTNDYPVWANLNCRDDLMVTLYDFEAMYRQAVKFLARWRAS